MCLFKTARHKFVKKFWGVDPEPVDVCSFLTAIGWSLILLHPTETFSRGAYQYLAELATEDLWGVWMCALGLAQGALVFWRMWYDRDRSGWQAMLVNFSACATWLYLGVSFLLTWPISTGAAAYTTLGIASLWSFLRTGRH